MNIYLDESGNFSKNDGNHFIVDSFTVGEPSRINKAFRKWQNRKFPKRLKYRAEVKFNDPLLTDPLRLETLTYIANQDIRIFYTHLKVEDIPEEYRDSGGKFKTGVLYTEIVEKTLELYLPSNDLEFRVFRDQRGLKGVTKSQFNEHLKASLLPQLPAKAVLQIEAMDSTTSPAIQVADWVCGALACYYEHKRNGEELYATIKRNIVEEKELLSSYWTKKWQDTSRVGVQ